ncbi:hypothetical protein WJX81_004751 [Elliptochloris bilobata]|uniref:Uncharacterized protein n=1 Tax=Elliptochloris bilobata TaxID=381761 RepID=A0AAW1QJ02_9CHLO
MERALVRDSGTPENRAATWLTLSFAALAWLLALSGVYGMQSVLGPTAKLVQFQWWLVVFQLAVLLASAVVHYASLRSLQPGVRATLCVLTPLVMLQTDVVNGQRQIAVVGAALLAALQREKLASDADSKPPDALADLLARVAAGAGGSAVVADMQRCADVVFLGFLFLGVLDLLLLWLLGAEAAACRHKRGLQGLPSSTGSELSKQGSAARDLHNLPLSVAATSATLSPRAPHPPGQQRV